MAVVVGESSNEFVKDDDEEEDEDDDDDGEEEEDEEEEEGEGSYSSISAGKWFSFECGFHTRITPFPLLFSSFSHAPF